MKLISLQMHQEMSDLEALVEAKIFKEDDLQQEIRRLEALMSQKQDPSGHESLRAPVAKSSIVDSDLQSRSMAGGDHLKQGVPTYHMAAKGICENCQLAGHDLFDCPQLLDGPTALPVNNHRKAGQAVWCTSLSFAPYKHF